MIRNTIARLIVRGTQCHQVTQRRCLDIKKKFYQVASVVQNDDRRFEIKLDKRTLKTPQGKRFELENETLAQMIAQEWNGQQETIKRTEMHLTSLANTQLDNPCNLDKQQIIENVLGQLSSDTLCYRVAEPADLSAYLKRSWDPLIADFERTYNCRLPVTDSVFLDEIPGETIDAIRNYLGAFELNALFGLQFVLDNLKSVVLTLALANKTLTVEEAVKLSRLELEFQIEKWGNVEWAHDLDLMQLQSRVSSGLIFFLLNNELHRQDDSCAREKL